MKTKNNFLGQEVSDHIQKKYDNGVDNNRLTFEDARAIFLVIVMAFVARLIDAQHLLN